MRGSQVLDIEELGRHRGSLLGGAADDSPDRQPMQKMFESEIARRLRSFDAARPLWVESESSKIGALHIPRPLWDAMRIGASVEITLPMESRVEYLVAEYAHLLENRQDFTDKLTRLTPHCGAKTVAAWCGMLERGEYRVLAADLLARHYDPAYKKSTVKIFGEPDLVLESSGMSDTDKKSLLDRLVRFEDSIAKTISHETSDGDHDGSDRIRHCGTAEALGRHDGTRIGSAAPEVRRRALVPAGKAGGSIHTSFFSFSCPVSR